MTDTERQTWIAALAVILTVIGAAWWTGRQMATREDLAAVRQELTNFRGEMQAQMQELRGYIVQHLDGHAPDPN